jgi:hypothetical protein
MMRATILCLALTTTSALAQDYTEADKATFLAAFANSGCAMTIAEAQEALTPLGMEFETADRIAGSLMDAGQATVSDDFQTLTLSSEVCP